MSEELAEVLQSYDWPGNVRELRNEMERMRIMNSDKLQYSTGDLTPELFAAGQKYKDTSELILSSVKTEVPTFQSKVPQMRNTSLRQSKGEKIKEILQSKKSQLRRREYLKELFVLYGTLRKAEILKILEISPSTATKDLKALCKEEFIRRIEPTAAQRTHYFILSKAAAKESS